MAVVTVSLKRDIGVIGLWASMGSIIGSGWLFVAEGASARPARGDPLLGDRGGVAILVLALVHELGAMYPVSGGSTRFPHYAFGGVAARRSAGSPCCRRRPSRRSRCRPSSLLTRYRFASGWPNADQTLTASGVGRRVVLMAIMSSVSFSASASLRRRQCRDCEGRRAAGDDLRRRESATCTRPTSPPPTNSLRTAPRASSPPSRPAAMIFAYLGFEQADRGRRGRARTPSVASHWRSSGRSCWA